MPRASALLAAAFGASSIVDAARRERSLLQSKATVSQGTHESHVRVDELIVGPSNGTPDRGFARLQQEGLHLPPASLPDSAVAAEVVAGIAVLNATGRGESGWAQDSLATRLGSDARWAPDPAWAQEQSSLPSLQPSRAPSSRIPHVILQTMETWDSVTDFPALSSSMTNLRKAAAAGGWEYRFFNASAREELVTKCPILSRMGLVIEATESDERAVISQTVSADSGLSADAAMALLRKQNNLGIRLSLDYASELEQPQVQRGVPISELYFALTESVTRSDFFRVLAIYAYGGFYLDSKSGIKHERNVNNVVFGLAQDDSSFTESDTRFALTYWGPKVLLGVSDTILLKPEQAELPFRPHAEFFNGGFAAQPRHRYLFRAAELIARQIYLLRQSIRYTGKEGLVLPTGEFYQTVGKRAEFRFTGVGQRKANVLVLTGPYAFTNAIVQEMWRNTSEVSGLVNVAHSESLRGIQFITFANYEKLKPHKYESGISTGLVRPDL
jgi:hypothetical protein